MKETGGMSLDDKIRRCEEIKSRYRKGAKEGDSHEGVREGQYDQQGNNSSMLMMSSGYLSPRK